MHFYKADVVTQMLYSAKSAFLKSSMEIWNITARTSSNLLGKCNINHVMRKGEDNLLFAASIF